MFDPSKLGEMLQQFQQKAGELQQQGESRVHTAKSGGGMVQASVNGKGEVVDITLDDSLLEDKESLQILLMSAINDALRSSEEDRKQMAMQMLGGLAAGGLGRS